MKTRGICFFDPYDHDDPRANEEWFTTTYVPERLRPRLLAYLYTQRPELRRLHTHGSICDVPEGVFLDVGGGVFQPHRLVTTKVPRGYKVFCYLSQVHAVVDQLREGPGKGWLLIEDGKGLPWAVVPGMRHMGVLYADDVERVADAFAERAVEGATLYEGLRAQAVTEGHIYDGRKVKAKRVEA